MSTLQQHHPTHSNYALLLYTQLQSAATSLLTTMRSYSHSLSLRHSKYPLLNLLHRSVHYWLRILSNLLRTLYWLLAPDMLVRITLRHYVLFAMMFLLSPLMRLTVKPMYRWLRYHVFLRLVMGREWVRSYREIKAAVATCTTYGEFGRIVARLDEMEGLDAWRINKQSRLYSHHRLHQDLMEMTKLRRKCDDHSMLRQNHTQIQPSTGDVTRHSHPMRELMQFLRSRIERNYCGITDVNLYTVTKMGTKKLIEDFREGICQSLGLTLCVCHDRTPFEKSPSFD